MKTNVKRSRGMLYFIVLGVVSIIWMLLRVIPKPSRITYPCQRMAAANAVAFITWLFGTAIAATFFRKAFKRLRESRIPVAVVLILLAVVTGLSTVMLTSYKEIKASVVRQSNGIFTPTDLNQPMGTAKGIHPGRVTWAHDPDAVNYDPAASNGFWWEDRNTDPERVDRMFDLSLDGVTGATTSYGGWDMLFRDANIRKGTGDVGYAPSEKIAIKANLLLGLGGQKEVANSPGPTPQLLHAIVEDLIEEVGVPGECITVYDVSARIPDYIMDPFKNHEKAEYHKVRFVGNPLYVRDAGDSEERYIPALQDLAEEIHFADPTVADIFWVKPVTESDYLINLTNLKGHTMAGVTLCAKNLYGSLFIPTATREFWETGNYLDGFGPNNVTDSLGNPDPHRGLHRCAAVHEFYDGNIGNLPAREMGTYNYLVDLLGHPQIRNKTILYIVEAFYGSDQQNRIVKFDSFGDDYCSSLFMSQDVVALESVCVDFLRSEPKNSLHVHGNVDNWLHESAQAGDPPSGMVYNPGAEEAPLESLGVHEHWNSWEEKQYTRNLGSGDGIELYTVDLTVGLDDRTKPDMKAELEFNYPNPFSGLTTIPYNLTKETGVNIAIIDQSGRIIETLVDGRYPAGSYSTSWDATNYPGGIYFCRMQTGEGGVCTIELQKIN
ncbi:MAG: DUF362 domain-containing protein [Bacteroidota bacterium]